MHSPSTSVSPSSTEPVHFLQIWLEPNKQGVKPSYDQIHFPPEARRGRWALFVSPDGQDGSIGTHQDALLYGTLLESAERLEYRLETGRRGYVHVARGQVRVGNHTLNAGDGLAVSDPTTLPFEGIDSAEILLFDLP